MLTMFFLPWLATIKAMVGRILVSSSMTGAEQTTMPAQTIFMGRRLEIGPILQLPRLVVNEKSGMNIEFAFHALENLRTAPPVRVYIVLDIDRCAN
jgi:hypothetical protein